MAQRERIQTRSCKGLTRAQYYPELFTNPRKFNPQDFQLQRIFEYLSNGKWFRVVSGQGQTEMFGEYYQVGLKHQGKKATVKLEFVDSNPFWSFYDEKAILVKQLPPKNLLNRQFSKII